MKKFIEKHKDIIHGVIGCVDRIIFKGYSNLSNAQSMENYLSYKGILIKDFKKYVVKLSAAVKEHGLYTAQKYNRPYYRPTKKYDKEERAREIAERDKITNGLVCVLSAMESGPTFKMIPGEKRPKLINCSIPHLSLYYYYMDKVFGLMHVRIQTYLPFTVQIYINGHEWLARKMLRHGIKFEKDDNCFTWIEDIERAQKFADKFPQIKWGRILSAFANKVNPLASELFLDGYYFVSDQVEYATDVMFNNSNKMEGLFYKLLELSSRRFGPKDILTFIGKRFDGRFKGTQINSAKKYYWGARIKHWIKNNWIKMYNKSGSVLRIETVINDPKSFKVLRKGKRYGVEINGWYPLAKGIKNLYRYAEIGAAANSRYLDALSIEDDPAPASESLRLLTEPIIFKKKRYIGFNPVSSDTVKLFKSVMNGEYIAFGFQNKNVRIKLFGFSNSIQESRRLSSKTTRLLKKMKMHKLIAKIPRSRRWRVTEKGWQIMSSAVDIYDVGWQQVYYKKTA